VEHSVAGEVTAGLVESNGSPPPGLWLQSPVGWLPRTLISPGTICSYQVCDYRYLSSHRLHIHRLCLTRTSKNDPPTTSLFNFAQSNNDGWGHFDWYLCRLSCYLCRPYRGWYVD